MDIWRKSGTVMLLTGLSCLNLSVKIISSFKSNGSESAALSNPVYSTPGDSLLFLEKTSVAAQVATDFPDKTLAVATSFLGTPYIHGTLDGNPTEGLVVNLRDLDCWTFVECSLALAKTQLEGGDYQAFKARLQQLRYWGGTIDGYGSRIHYFSGWVLQAQKFGYLHDITQELGGVPYQKKIGYISARPAKYPEIRNPENLRALRGSEARINAHHWYFIPKTNIKSMEHLIREGDLLLLTTVKKDLDVAHQGFAVKRNGRIHLLHASSLGKRVLISPQPLPEYMMGQKGQSGIMVIRLGE